MTFKLWSAQIVLSLCLWGAAIPVSSQQSAESQPKNATEALLAAFDTYDVVGMSAGHSNEKLDDFILSLLRNPRLSTKVNDLVVECGNARYQATLDRYIGGDPVSIEDARRAWRETSVSMCSVSAFYAELFPLVRQINQSLPVARRLRVVVSEPPVDWAASPPTRGGLDRDTSLASVIEQEVLPKKRKALVLCGTGHLYHNERRGTAVSRYEQIYPGRTFVIQNHDGFAAFIDLDRGRQLEARMSAWPVPALVSLKGSWLADLDLPYFLWPFPARYAGEKIGELADAYLYLGPGNDLTYEKTPDSILDDQAYIAELSRRFGTNVDSLRQRNNDRRLFSAADRQEALKFAPGAPFVGAYAMKKGDSPSIEIDYRDGKLSARLASSGAWVNLASDNDPNKFRLAQPSQTVIIEFEPGAGGAAGLTLDQGDGQPTIKLVRVS
jgi:hypothetical protein